MIYLGVSMKKLIFTIISMTITTPALCTVFISDKSIQLQKVWESPQTGWKTKLRIIYHDLKEPWPWKPFWDYYGHVFDIMDDKNATLKERAILRVYDNKTLAVGIPLVGAAILTMLADIYNRSKKKRFKADPKILSFIAVLHAMNLLNLTFSDIFDRGAPKDDAENIVKRAYRASLRRHHPDKTGASQASIRPHQIRKAHDELLRWIRSQRELSPQASEFSTQTPLRLTY